MAQIPTKRVRPAGFISRLLAFMIDLMIATLLMAFILVALRELALFFGLSGLINEYFGDRYLIRLIQSAYSVIYLVISNFTTIIYFSVLSWLIGTTPGKYLMGLRIIRLNGKPVGFVRSLVRTLGNYLSFVLLGLGFIWIIFDRRRQALHDKLVGTLVIYEQRNK